MTARLLLAAAPLLAAGCPPAPPPAPEVVEAPPAEVGAAPAPDGGPAEEFTQPGRASAADLLDLVPAAPAPAPAAPASPEPVAEAPAPRAEPPATSPPAVDLLADAFVDPFADAPGVEDLKPVRQHGETEEEKIRRLEREAGRRVTASPEPAPSTDGRPRPDPARRPGQAAPAGDAPDPAAVAVMMRASEAAKAEAWDAYVACFTAPTVNLFMADWALSLGVGAWASEQQGGGRRARISSRVLWSKASQAGVTRAMVQEIVDGQASARSALQTLALGGARDPVAILRDVASALGFVNREPFLARFRVDEFKGKGPGAKATLTTPHGRLRVEFQGAGASGLTVHVRDADAWLDRAAGDIERAIAAAKRGE